MDYFDHDMIVAMGKRIQKIRKENKMSQMQLAEQLSISTDQLSNIENGKSVCKPDYLFIIAQMWNVSADYVLFGGITYRKENLIEEKIINLLSEIDDGGKEKIYKLIMLVLEIKVA